jgi:hypothetical protein
VPCNSLERMAHRRVFEVEGKTRSQVLGQSRVQPTVVLGVRDR